MIDKAEISLKRLHEDLVVVIKVIMYFTTELLQKFIIQSLSLWILGTMNNT